MSVFGVIASVVIQLTNGVSFVEALSSAAAERARDAKQGIEIVVGVKGRALSQPIVIDSALQPKGAGKLTIRGEGGVRPRIFGSSSVKGWKRLGKKMNGRNDVWVADVSDRNLEDQLESLFLDGRMMTLARYPNFNPKMPYSGGWAYVPGRWISMYDFPKVEPAGNRIEMKVGEKDWHDWAVPSEGRIVIFPRQRFGSSYVRIADLDRATKTVRFASNLCDVPRPGDSYILSGFREELDDFGEWCHDLKGKKLYFIPPKGVDPEKHLVTIPTLGHIVEVRDASNVSFENLEFCAGLGGAIVQGGASNAFRGCVFHDLARLAVDLAGGKDHLVGDCDFYDLGRGAVHITGGGNRENPNGTTVENCHIHHIGRLSHADSAIFMEGCGFRVRHNLFHDLPHWAVFHTGNCHELTDNRVHHYMLETEDGAAFYTCNPNGNRNTVVARNWISDGIGFGKCAGYGPLAFYVNSHGLYFDAGPGGGKIYDNVIERVSCMALKMDSNDNQLVSNNVFHCIGRPELHHWSYMSNLSGASSVEKPCCSNVLVRNIWNYPNCPEGTYVLVQGADVSLSTIDYNWICTGKEGGDPRPRNGDLKLIPWKEDWQRKRGADVHSVVSKSIAFVKPEAGDFTPKNRDIPKKLGIHPLNLKDAGLYVSEFRKSIGPEPDGCANHPEWLKHDPNHVNPRQSQRKNGQKGKRNNENDQRK